MTWCVCILAVIFVLTPAYGAVEEMTLEEMVKDADIIVTRRWM